MAISKLSNDRYRAHVKHPATGKRVSVSKVLGEAYHHSYATEREARKAEIRAAAKLDEEVGTTLAPTVRAWRERWLTDALFTSQRQKPRGPGTLLHYRSCTDAFVKEHGNLRLNEVTDRIAAAWNAGGRRNDQIKVLSTMYKDAASRTAGRLVTQNPFEGLFVKSAGRGKIDPPTWDEMWALVHAARRLTTPSFAAWLQLACFTGMRTGEVDALKWDDVDLDGTALWLPEDKGFDGGWLRVDEQWHAKLGRFAPPKGGTARDNRTRLVPLHAEAIDALEQVRGDHDVFCFTNTHGAHWRANSRDYHWRMVRAATGFEDDLYLATRHFAGWLMYERMGLADDLVGIALGHTGADVGALIRSTYGHRDRVEALKTVKRVAAEWDRPNRLRAA